MHTTRLAALALALTGCPVSDDAGATADTATDAASAVQTLTYDATTAGETITPEIGNGSDVPPLYQVWTCTDTEYGPVCRDVTDTWLYVAGFLCGTSDGDAAAICYGGGGFASPGHTVIRWIE